jgi:hypothetical protein
MVNSRLLPDNPPLFTDERLIDWPNANKP